MSNVDDTFRLPQISNNSSLKEYRPDQMGMKQQMRDRHRQEAAWNHSMGQQRLANYKLTRSVERLYY